MDTFESIDNQEPKIEPRPSFLTVLCVLSFIFIGFSLAFGLMGLSQGPLSAEQMVEQKVELTKSVDEMRSLDLESFAVMMEKIQRMSESINASFYASSILSLLVIGLGLYGVIQMWKGKKFGFHLYIGYSLLSIIQIYFFVAPIDIPSFVVTWNLIVSALFVFMYARNLKWLK
jgi:hypothetical protein